MLSIELVVSAAELLATLSCLVEKASKDVEIVFFLVVLICQN